MHTYIQETKLQSSKTQPFHRGGGGMITRTTTGRRPESNHPAISHASSRPKPFYRGGKGDDHEGIPLGGRGIKGGGQP